MRKITTTAPLLSERFEVSFNRIHEALKNIVKSKDDRFTFLLRVGAGNHHIINTYKDDLEQYAKLRNALVHDKVRIGYYIAEPNVQVVERIEKIASILTRPNYALSIATKNVVFYDSNESIMQVINGIKEYGYSQYPIYSNKKAVGLLNTGDILKWMAVNGVNNFLDLETIRIDQVLKSRKQTTPLKFVPKALNIFEVEDLFETAHKTRSDLAVIIITENGQPDEKPLGLVTPWDLIEIDYTVD